MKHESIYYFGDTVYFLTFVQATRKYKVNSGKVDRVIFEVNKVLYRLESPNIASSFELIFPEEDLISCLDDASILADAKNTEATMKRKRS